MTNDRTPTPDMGRTPEDRSESTPTTQPKTPAKPRTPAETPAGRKPATKTTKTSTVKKPAALPPAATAPALTPGASASTPPAIDGPHTSAEPAPGARPASAPLRVLIGGASGMIGTEVIRQLEEQGHTVLRLVRTPPRAENEFTWSPESKIVDRTLMGRVDAVLNLSGASISRLPWTASYKEKILASRISATETLVEAMRRSENPPAVFLSGSAVGYYGDRPGEKLTEDSPRGAGYLADVVEKWENAALGAPPTTRVVLLRTGLVLGDAGALKPIRLLTRLGLSGPLGTGGQHWPWIGLRDEAAAIVHLLSSSISGPVNLVGPTPATADRLMRHLAERLRRSYFLRVPERVIGAALGDAGRDLLLASQKIRPTRLLADGFRFSDRTVEEAIDRAVATPHHAATPAPAGDA